MRTLLRNNIALSLLVSALLTPIATLAVVKKPAQTETKLNSAITRVVGSAQHVFYNGKDMGEFGAIDQYAAFVSLVDGHIVFSRALKERNGEAIQHFIYDGKDLGAMISATYKPISKSHYAFVALKNPTTAYVNHDGKDLGKGGVPQVEGDHFVYYILEHLTGRQQYYGIADVMYDNHRIKDVAMGSFVMSGDQYACTRYINGQWRVFYNGKDVGEGDSIVLSSGHILFIKRKNVAAKGNIILDGKDTGIQYSDEQYALYNNHIITVRSVGTKEILNGIQDNVHVFLDNKDIGETDTMAVPHISGNHILFTNTVNGVARVVYDGKDIGPGNNPVISGDHLAFSRTLKDGKSHIILDGKDIGEGDQVFLGNQPY